MAIASGCGGGGGTPDGGSHDLAAFDFAEPDHGGIDAAPSEGGPAFASPHVSCSSFRGYQGGSIAIADFNGDHIPDIAVAEPSLAEGFNDSVQIFLVAKDGTISRSVEKQVGGQPSEVAVGDLNRDGRPDLVVSTAEGMAVLLGDGGGGFSGPVYFGSAGIELVVADADGDGILDVVTFSTQFTSLILQHGRGDGTLAPPISIPSANEIVAGMAVGDLDGDGRPDVIGVDGVANVFLLFLGSKAGFLPPKVISTNRKSGDPQITDLNGDGLADVLISGGSGLINVFPGTGGGIAAMPLDSKVGQGFVGPLALADFDGDQKLDGVAFFDTQDERPNIIGLVLGDGAGHFVPSITLATGVTVNQIGVADFNQDGRMDIAVLDPKTICIYLNYAK